MCRLSDSLQVQRDSIGRRVVPKQNVKQNVKPARVNKVRDPYARYHDGFY